MRLSKTSRSNDAEFAVLVADEMQGKGLGTELVRHIIEIAKREGVRDLWCEILQGNSRMQDFCQRAGMHVSTEVSDGIVRAEMKLN